MTPKVPKAVKELLLDRGVWPAFVVKTDELVLQGMEVDDAARTALNDVVGVEKAAELLPVKKVWASKGNGTPGQAVVGGVPAVGGGNFGGCAPAQGCDDAGGDEEKWARQFQRKRKRRIEDFDADAVKALRGKSAAPAEWVMWIARSMEGEIDIGGCPDVGALNYLLECRLNPSTKSDFWRAFMSKAAKMEPEKDNGALDGAGQIDIISKILGFREKVLRGGAGEARLAHTQEVAGSNPAPATNLSSGVSAHVGGEPSILWQFCGIEEAEEHSYCVQNSSPDREDQWSDWSDWIRGKPEAAQPKGRKFRFRRRAS